jgi:hypothetical protein
MLQPPPRLAYAKVKEKLKLMTQITDQAEIIIEKHPLNNVVLMHFSYRVWDLSGCQSHPTTLGCHANGQMYVSFQQQDSQSCANTTYC